MHSRICLLQDDHVGVLGAASDVIGADEYCFRVYALASEVNGEDLKDYPDNTRSTDVLPEWLKLQHGAYNMLKPYGRMIYYQPNSPFNRTTSFHNQFTHCANSYIDCTLNPFDDQLASVVPLFSGSLSSPLSSSSQDQMANEICMKVLTDLRRVFALSYATGLGLEPRDAVAFWPIRQSPHFFDLLTDDNPKALIMLAFYCVSLKRAEAYWYLRGQGRKLLADIRNRLAFGWEHWIAWPLYELGLESSHAPGSISGSQASPSDLKIEERNDTQGWID